MIGNYPSGVLASLFGQAHLDVAFDRAPQPLRMHQAYATISVRHWPVCGTIDDSRDSIDELKDLLRTSPAGVVMMQVGEIYVPHGVVVTETALGVEMIAERRFRRSPGSGVVQLGDDDAASAQGGVEGKGGAGGVEGGRRRWRSLQPVSASTRR